MSSLLSSILETFSGQVEPFMTPIDGGVPGGVRGKQQDADGDSLDDVSGREMSRLSRASEGKLLLFRFSSKLKIFSG